LTRVKHMKSATNIAQFDYTLNAVGNRTAKNASGAIPNVNESYTYDAIDQVTGASKPGDAQTFAYDPTGNRTAVTSTGSSPGVGSYTTNALNQYSAFAGDVLLYDTKGNLTTQGLSASYNYDSKNRLLGAMKGSNTMSVAYDYRNRPVSRTINGTATYFIYDGWSLIGEYNVSGALLQKYIHGVNIDEILAKIDTTGTVFYHQDGLGSTVALTNSSGALLESYQYDVFGKATISDNSALPIASSAFSNRFMFTGREWIAEAGLYDYRNRVYSAELGRFIQTDPIRFDAGDVNFYRYVGNNAVNGIDPLALSSLFPYGTNAIKNLGSAAAKLGPLAKGAGLGGFALGYLANYDKFLECLDKAADNLGKNLAKCCPTDTECQALAYAIYASESANCAQTQIANSLGADGIAAAISNGLNFLFPGSK